MSTGVMNINALMPIPNHAKVPNAAQLAINGDRHTPPASKIYENYDFFETFPKKFLTFLHDI